MLARASLLCVPILLESLTANLAAAPQPSSAEARTALRRAVQFFRQDVSTEGGYLWRYSQDLSRPRGKAQPMSPQFGFNLRATRRWAGLCCVPMN